MAGLSAEAVSRARPLTHVSRLDAITVPLPTINCRRLIPPEAGETESVSMRMGLVCLGELVNGI